MLPLRGIHSAEEHVIQKLQSRYSTLKIDCQYHNMNKEAHAGSTRSLGMFMYHLVKTVFNSCLSSK